MIKKIALMTILVSGFHLNLLGSQTEDHSLIVAPSKQIESGDSDKAALAKKYYLVHGTVPSEFESVNNQWGISFGELMQADKSGWPELQGQLFRWNKTAKGYALQPGKKHLNSLAGLQEFLNNNMASLGDIISLSLSGNNFMEIDLSLFPRLNVLDVSNNPLNSDFIAKLLVLGTSWEFGGDIAEITATEQKPGIIKVDRSQMKRGIKNLLEQSKLPKYLAYANL